MISWLSIIGYGMGIVYIYTVVLHIQRILNPLANIPEEILLQKDRVIKPYWKENSTYSIIGFLSPSSKFNVLNITELRFKEQLVLDKDSCISNSSAVDIFEDVILKESSITIDSSYLKKDHRILTKISNKVWNKLQSNHTGVYLHVLLFHNTFYRSFENDVINKSMLQSGDVLYGVVQMIKQDIIPKDFLHRYLLEDFGLVNPNNIDVIKRNSYNQSSRITFWKPEVTVRLVADFTNYPIDYATSSIRKNTISYKNKLVYKPSVHIDEIGLTSDKYIPLNKTSSTLPLRISIGTMSIQRWLLMNVLEESIQGQKDLGFTDKDTDDIRRLISDTSIYYLGITLLASVLHLYFEMLALKSDVSFWSSNKSLSGLSSRSVLFDLFSQVIVFLFLLHEDTSLLIIVPCFISILIQIWKVIKVLRISKSNANEADDMEKLTREAENISIQHMSRIFIPLIIGFVLQALIYQKYSSWYSWLISSLTSMVHTIGFIFMMPQLYINYKLKSVSFMPWKVLVYRFINTFIDDLFAFIIKMPTIHRISVFRDDIIFIIFLYQRWIYKTDNRVEE